MMVVPAIFVIQQAKGHLFTNRTRMLEWLAEALLDIWLNENECKTSLKRHLHIYVHCTKCLQDMTQIHCAKSLNMA